MSKTEKGSSSIPNTRPRFGWQEDDEVTFLDENGEKVDLDVMLKNRQGQLKQRVNPFSGPNNPINPRKGDKP